MRSDNSERIAPSAIAAAAASAFSARAFAASIAAAAPASTFSTAETTAAPAAFPTVSAFDIIAAPNLVRDFQELQSAPPISPDQALIHFPVAAGGSIFPATAPCPMLLAFSFIFSAKPSEIPRMNASINSFCL